MYGQNTFVPQKKSNTWPILELLPYQKYSGQTPRKKDWYSFWARLQHHFERLDNRGVNYAPTTKAS